MEKIYRSNMEEVNDIEDINLFYYEKERYIF